MRVWFAGGGTGGHLYPALAIARVLVQMHPEIQPLFIGARRGIEREVLPRSEFPHVLLELHPLYRSAVWQNWRTVAGGFRAWRELARLARQDPPAAIVATGGYAAGLALLYAAMRGVPIVLQEQNSVPGLTTRFFSRFARQIHLGFPEAASALRPPREALVKHTGNPIQPPPAVDAAYRRDARAHWRLSFPDSRVLLVFGGSQGARAINQTVAELVHGGLPSGLQLLWITGTGEYEQYRALDSESVRVVPFITDMSQVYAATDLAVARAGAMSTAELCAWGIPAVLVPLPTAAADHQTTNALALERAGAATVIRQRDLTSERLRSTVAELLADARRMQLMVAEARSRARPDAAAEIARDVASLTTAA